MLSPLFCSALLLSRGRREMSWKQVLLIIPQMLPAHSRCWALGQAAEQRGHLNGDQSRTRAGLHRTSTEDEDCSKVQLSSRALVHSCRLCKGRRVETLATSSILNNFCFIFHESDETRSPRRHQGGALPLLEALGVSGIDLISTRTIKRRTGGKDVFGLRSLNRKLI